MKTLDSENETAAPAQGFQFHGDECVNPHKTFVHCPMGFAAALLTAKNPEGRWWSGYQRGGKGVEYKTLLPGAAGAEGSRVGYGTQEEAIAAAGKMALESLGDGEAEQVLRGAIVDYFGGAPLVGDDDGKPAGEGAVSGFETTTTEVLENRLSTLGGEVNPSDRETSEKRAIENELERRGAWQPAANPHGFQFDAQGECTNPERVEVPCPKGVQCALLVARNAAGDWCFGYVYAQDDEVAKSLPKLDEASGSDIPSRGEALDWAAAAACDRAGAGSLVTLSINAWAEAVLKELAEVRAEKTPAFEGFVNGRRVDFPTREEAEAAREVESKRPGFQNYTTRIEQDGANSFALVYKRKAEVESVAHGSLVVKSLKGQSPNECGVFERVEKAIKYKRDEHVSAVVKLVPLADGRCAWGIDVTFKCGDMAGHGHAPGALSVAESEEGAIRLALDEIYKAGWAALPGQSASRLGPWSKAEGKAAEGLIAWVGEQREKHGIPASGEAAPSAPNDFEPLKGVALEKAALQLVEAGETAVGIAVKLKIAGPRAFRLLDKLGFDGPGPWGASGKTEESSPANTNEVPHAEAGGEALPIIPGLAHEWDSAGSCTTPELVKIALPYERIGIVALGQLPDGTWRATIFCGAKKEQQILPPSRTQGRVYPDRRAALMAALTLVEDRCQEEGRKVIAKFRAEHDLEDVPAIEAAVAPRPAPSYVTSFSELPLARIQRNPSNHRQHFDVIKLRELAASLVSEGLHQPIAVRRLLPGESPEGKMPLGDPSAPEFELIYGERRWRAAQMAKLPTLQAKIYEGLTRKQGTAIALIENLQREDINCMEKAEGYAQLMADESLTQEACADRVGKERSTVANALRLLRLPGRVRELLREGALTAAHGVALARFVPEDKPEARKEFPKWEQVITIMAEEAVRDKTPAGAMEKGVPSIMALQDAGLAARINTFAGEYRMPAKFKNHAAYFETRDGDYITFAPEHWRAWVKEQDEAKATEEAATQRRREDELAKLTKGGKKQLSIADLDRAAYREFEPVHESLLGLVPAEKKAAAKDGSRRTTVVTDVELADRLKSAMQRGIKANRKDAVAGLHEKVIKAVAKIKKVGPREFAWLAFLIVDPRGREVRLHLTDEAANAADVKYGLLARGARHTDLYELAEADRIEYQERRLGVLAKADPVAILRTLIVERLPVALDEMVESGPESTGGRFLKWWLETDTLWLLEETEEGREQLVEEVKGSAWFQKLLAGEAGGEGEES